VGAECVNCARSDLCGGQAETFCPYRETAEVTSFFVCKSAELSEVM